MTSESGSFLLSATPGEHTVAVSKDGYLPGLWKRDFKAGEKVSQAAQLASDTELQRWREISNKNDLTAAQAYVRDYPSGRFSAQARDRILQLEWNSLKDRSDAGAVLALSSFLERCPQGQSCSDARTRMNALKTEDEDWIKGRDSQSPVDVQAYLTKYPQGRYALPARDLLQRRNDEKDIRSKVDQYADAYNHRDMDKLISLWPTFPASAQLRTRELFKAAKSLNVALAVADLQITGNSAVVTCKRSRDVVRSDEAGGHTQDSVVFRMTKQSDHWMIESGPR